MAVAAAVDTRKWRVSPALASTFTKAAAEEANLKLLGNVVCSKGRSRSGFFPLMTKASPRATVSAQLFFLRKLFKPF